MCIRFGCAVRGFARRAVHSRPLEWCMRCLLSSDPQEVDRSWAEIGEAVRLPRETVWRQFKAGGPLVAVKPYQSADSPLSETERRPWTAASVASNEPGAAHRGWTSPPAEFIDAVAGVADSAVLGYRVGLQLTQARQRLERAVSQYQAWALRAGAQKP